jgi:hypothetical protein
MPFLCAGVFLNSAVLWDQTGFANVSCGCYAGALTLPFSLPSLSLSISLYLSCDCRSCWASLTSHYGGAAVYLNSGATWQQRANASISTRITEVQVPRAGNAHYFPLGVAPPLMPWSVVCVVPCVDSRVHIG